MNDKFVRNGNSKGSQWTLAPGERHGADIVEVYPLKFKDDAPALRISVTDYMSGTNTPGHGRVCMDLTSAREFAAEIIRLADDLEASR